MDFEKKAHLPDPQNPLPKSGDSREKVEEDSVIAGSFVLRGDLSAGESALIEGQVKGNILVHEHPVRISRTGLVRGEVFGQTIIVEGKVSGNLFAREKIILRRTADVLGNIFGGQVKLEDGCRFRGAIDMDPKARSPAITAAQRRMSAAFSRKGQKASPEE
jgi:cytoskeletal protein CcmA (bactofilin family)